MQDIAPSNLQAAAAIDSELKTRRQTCISVPVEVRSFCHSHPGSWEHRVCGGLQEA